MGLPCSHQMMFLICNSEKLELSHIHSQWHLDNIVYETILIEENYFTYNPEEKLKNRLDNVLYLLESDKKLAIIEKVTNILENPIFPLTTPKVINVKKRGRPIGSKNSTTRNKSSFEIEGERLKKLKHSKPE